jgi:tRNA pseudouridine32 synthase/23S rRNA pseudouridine746 synthase
LARKFCIQIKARQAAALHLAGRQCAAEFRQTSAVVLVGEQVDRPPGLRADFARCRLVSREHGVPGQRLQYSGEGILTAYLPPPDNGLAIIHVDNEIIVVDKPAGLLSVPGRGEGMDDCLASRVQARFPDALIAHRLDMSTSGLLVLARGAEMHSRLSRFFRERQIDKRYVAVVYGLMADDAGEVELPLICDWPNRPRQKVDFEIGKPSLTRFRVVSRDPATNTTRVELEPVTGRSHQLRVHMASLGHPILGDDLYGGEATALADRLLLHAMDLGLFHPLTAAAIQFHSDAPF